MSDYDEIFDDNIPMPSSKRVKITPPHEKTKAMTETKRRGRPRKAEESFRPMKGPDHGFIMGADGSVSVSVVDDAPIDTPSAAEVSNVLDVAAEAFGSDVVKHYRRVAAFVEVCRMMSPAKYRDMARWIERHIQ